MWSNCCIWAVAKQIPDICHMSRKRSEKVCSDEHEITKICHVLIINRSNNWLPATAASA